jgi:hypothetical protein
VNAGPTATVAATPTLPESPLPESPLASPTPSTSSPTPLTEATSPAPAETSDPLSGEQDPTDTPRATVSAGATATLTQTATLTSSVEPWRFENLFSYYDATFQDWYLWGEVVNDSAELMRIRSVYPVVLDQNGEAITSEENVDLQQDYDRLLDFVRLTPGQSLAFSFRVSLPDDTPVEDNYEILIEGEPVADTREDLEISDDSFDNSDWPDFFLVQGTFENLGPDLSEYIALVVTLYDETGHVLGVGWWYETDQAYFSADAHEFSVIVELRDILNYLTVDLYNYKIQAFGY